MVALFTVSRRRRLGAAAAGTALLALAGANQAAAAERPRLDLSANVGASTDYVFRGVSQTNEDPQLFGGLDAAVGSIGYAGAWLSNVDFGDSTDFEFDLYAGIRPNAGPVTLDLGVIYYGYADQPGSADYDYWEGKLAASIPAGPAAFGAAVYYSPDFFGSTDEAVYYEANASAAIPNSRFTLSGAVGRQWVEGPGDYTTWNLGLGYAVTDHLGLDLRYHDTDEHRLGDVYDSRLVGGLKLTY